jgi:hypothetical protein
MVLPLAVILGSVGLGLLAGGRLRRLERLRLRWWALAPIGLGMQLAPVPSDPGNVATAVSTAMVIASFPVLLVFVANNLRTPGFPALLIGLALNFAVITPNGGMPVSAGAIRTASGSLQTPPLERSDPKHHILTDQDVLTPLADIIAVGPPLRAVLSAGDLFVYSGLAWLIIATMREPTQQIAPTRPSRGYRGKHRIHRRPPPAAHLVLRPAATARSGTAQ